MTNLIDNYLLFRLKTKRDPEAFARIYDRHVEAIYRFVFFKLSSKEEAEDITAETFTKAWNYLSQNHKVLNIKALLYRIARNLVIDSFRHKNSLSQEIVVTNSGDETSNILEELSDKGHDKKIIEARADFALIIKQLDKLKDDYRDILMLRLLDDLPFNIIAEILEKKSGHVRVIYHRALKALKEVTKS